MAKDPSNLETIEAFTTTAVLVGPEHDVVTGDTTGGGFTITLPPLAGVAGTTNPTVPAIPAIPFGKRITFFNIGSANTLTIAGSALNGSDLINGAATSTVLSSQYAWITVVAQKALNWLILA